MPSMAVTHRNYLLASKQQTLDSSERSTFSVHLSPPTLSKKRRAKSLTVSFDLVSNSVHDISSREDVARDACAELWYTPHELRELLTRIQTTLRLMDSGKFNGKLEEFSFRGIETETDKMKRQDRIASLKRELLWFPTKDFFSRPDISTKLQDLSRTAQEEAVLRAKYDRQAALKAYRKIRQ